MARKFTVSMAVDCRVDVSVEAESPEEAFKKAETAFMGVDLGDVESIVGAVPVNAFDVENQVLTDR